MISSRRNKHVALCRSLHRPKGRREAKAFLVEGQRLAAEALRSGGEMRLALYDPAKLHRSVAGRELTERLANLPAAMVATESVIAAASETQAPSGVVLVVDLPARLDPQAIVGQNAVLVLDGLSDPGNVGTAMRSAAAAGLKFVVLAGNVADPYDGKVVRSAMGSHFRLGLVRTDWKSLAPHLGTFSQIIGADARAPRTIYEVDWSCPWVLVVGDEAAGISIEGRQTLTGTASIPMSSGVESLNAAVAASVILFEARKAGRING